MNLRLGAGESDNSYWTVLSDVMTSMFFLVVLYVLGQHLKTFKETVIGEALAARQREVAEVLSNGLGPSLRSKLSIDSLAPDRQKLTFSSDVLFGPCRSNLTPDGRTLLVAVGRALKSREAYMESIQVEGHTDRQPTGSYGCTYATNWELSSERATSVVRLMRDASGVTGNKLSAMGLAEFHPVRGAEADDRESYARNRRIEIVLQYDRALVEKP